MPESRFEFRPSFGLRNGHSQSLLSSSAVRRRIVRKRSEAVVRAACELILDGGPDTEAERLLGQPGARARLQAYWSGQPRGDAPVAVLFHGWEGSASSNYVLANAARLWQSGFSVLRLNFRDHGDSHHLNPGLFHSCRLDEVLHALADWQARCSVNGWGLCGYSLGGNFALRVALHAKAAGLHLNHVVAVCPVIEPGKAMRAMEDSYWIYNHYFDHKWSRSLRLKQKLFPDLYGGDEKLLMKGLNARTDYTARTYSGFDSAQHYYDSYSVGNGRLQGIAVPSTILTATNDPVVPVEDFEGLGDIHNIDLRISAHGGHCGFLENWKFESAAEDLILERFRS